MSRMLLRAGLLAGATVAYPAMAFAQQGQVQEQIVVTGSKSVAERDNLPGSSESVTAGELKATTNVVNTEDALKYLPSVLIRKRHVGDTQAPLATRTSGLGSSARSLIFADGVLLSALIGNNNSFASPRWGMVAPEEIERIDVMYGPFAAQYAGNSIGTVVEISTRMPDEFVASANIETSVQTFDQYSTKDTYPAYQASALIGDRLGDFSWRLSLNHLDAHSQPLSYVTATRPGSASGSGTPVTGAFDDRNRTGAAIAVLGAGGLEYQRQDNLTAKFAYEVAPNVQLTYLVGLFLNNDKSGVQTYLSNAGGTPFYSGSLNIGGYNYSVAASAFSNNQYHLTERHWMHGATLGTMTPGVWEWQVAGSYYIFGSDVQRIPTTALPGALNGGAGTVTYLDGTGWYTGDAKGVWRPDGMDGEHQVSFGGHFDRNALANSKYNTANWIDGPLGALSTQAKGNTGTFALWVQDVWQFQPDWKLTLGGRFEWWRAYNGFNYSASPALSTNQPKLNASGFSPKATLSWQFAPDWTATASIGVANRFPTVSELYQAVTTGSTLTVPNPNLKPEHALSGEFAVERNVMDGKVRVSLFQESISDALISQSAPLVTGSTTLFNYVQNINRVRTFGVEIVAEQNNVLFSGLTLQGSVTYADPEIASDPVFLPAQGKQIPGVPHWRGTMVASYRPDEDWTFTLAARYSDRVYSNIDNTDFVTHTYQGFDGYFVMDARVSYQFAESWNIAVGVDNVNDRKYFLFHPFPQRTFVAELHYAY